MPSALFNQQMISYTDNVRPNMEKVKLCETTFCNLN